MSVDLTERKFQAPVELGVAESVIAGLAKRVEGAKADTPAGYEVVRKGLAECRNLRKKAKESHRELKESALRWGQACDAELRRVNGLIQEVEFPLKDEKKRVDDEKERKRIEKIEAKRRDQEEKERAERERIQKEQEAERARLEEERKQIEAEREAALKKQREEEARLAEERRKLQEEKDNLEAERRQREEEERKKIEAAERKHREELEAKRRKEAEAEAKRLREERQPDSEKLLSLGVALAKYEMPEMSTPWGLAVIGTVMDDLLSIQGRISKAIEHQNEV